MNTTAIPQCTKLQMPDSLFNASYGGGDEMRLAQRYSACRIVNKTIIRDLPDALPFGWNNWKTTLWNDISTQWAHYSTIHPNEAIVRLPKTIPDSLDKFSFSIDFVASGFIPTRQTYNAMFQGWLFEEHLQRNLEALGASKWPLIGIYSGHGIEIIKDQDPAWIGLNCLAPADQHVHTDGESIEVDGFVLEPEWQFGSDMAKFMLGKTTDGSPHSGWIVSVDLETHRVKLVFTILIEQKDQDLIDKHVQQLVTLVK